MIMNAEESGKSMKLSFLGGAMEVGASCILFETSGYRILLDCGIRQKGTGDSLPDLQKIQEAGGIDAIVVSHAHMDHTGALPIISREYPAAPIYMTAMTMDLARVLLFDSIKLMEHQEDGIQLYNQKQVLDMLDRVRPVRYSDTLEILPDITLTMYPAGHIAGAACVYLVTPDGTLFYSGDFSSFSQNTIEGAMIPKLRPDVAIIESTYGDRLHANRKVEEERLLELVRSCAGVNGKMLIPAFALGRAQEVLLILKHALTKHLIPKIPVYADGMVREICTVYERYPTYLKRPLVKAFNKGKSIFYTDLIQPVPENADRNQLVEGEGPMIIVSSSGMLTGGPSVQYAQKIAPLENGFIVITGYQDEEAPGRQIQNLMNLPVGAERVLRLDGKPVPVHCRLCQVGLSAHGDRSEIQGLAERLSPRHLFLVHGDEQVIPKLATSLDLTYRTRIYTPKDGESEEIVLRSPRKQLRREFQVTMKNKVAPDEISNPEEKKNLESAFREFLLENYPGRRFTIRELYYLWYGRDATEERTVEKFAAAFADSKYITRDHRRLFLYVPASDEELGEALRPHGANQQEIEEAASRIFDGIPVRKFGYRMEQKVLTLSLDFPRPYQKEMEKRAEQFQKETGFSVEIPTQPNEHAINGYLTGKFGSGIMKISIAKGDQAVTVRLEKKPEDIDIDALKKEWENLTGYRLSIVTPGENVQDAGKKPEDVYRAGEGAKMEQNQALSLIREKFTDLPDAPYKAGIASDSGGKFIRLSFLSPAQGRRNEVLLQELADRTGWRLVIADSVNQNGIMLAAEELMKTYSIHAAKNPSFLPGRRVLVVDAPDAEDDAFAAFAAEVEKRTGIPVERK